MHLSASVAGWIAIAAAVVAVASLAVAVSCFAALRRVRAAQTSVLGGRKADLVDFAVSLQGRIDDLHRAVDAMAARLDATDRRVDDAVSKTAIVRYDAYENSGGHQSSSVAFLDAERSGLVLSAIQ